MVSKSTIEATFAMQCRAYGLSPENEYKFHPERKWRFDFAWPDKMTAVECEGAVWTNGRHTRGSGFIADIEKYNEAAKLGWKVYRFDSGAIKSGAAIEFLLVALKLEDAADVRTIKMR